MVGSILGTPQLGRNEIVATPDQQVDQGLGTITGELNRALRRKGLQVCAVKSHPSPTATTFSVECGLRTFNLALTRKEIDDSQAHGSFLWVVKVRRFVAALPAAEQYQRRRVQRQASLRAE